MSKSDSLFNFYEEEFTQLMSSEKENIANIQTEGKEILDNMKLIVENCTDVNKKREILQIYNTQYHLLIQQFSEKKARRQLLDKSDSISISISPADLTDTLISSNKHIEESIQITDDMNMTGEKILDELSQQRTVLNKIKNGLALMKEKMLHAGSNMGLISKNLCSSKLFIFIAISICLLVVILIICLKLIPRT